MVRILVSNDDGVGAPGLEALADALRPLGEVFICAPEGVRSGASSSLTLHEPLLVREISRNCWGVSGNPADAVKFALHELLKDRPDLVVSGINNGLNTGANVLYSGTVAAALEGAQAGILSFAVSRKCAPNDDFRREARLAARIIGKIVSGDPRRPGVFNVNIPSGAPRGVLVTATDLTPYADRYERRRDPRGRAYYWLKGEPPRKFAGNGQTTDHGAIARGYVSVTPLRRDLTDKGRLSELSDLLDKRLLSR